MLFHDNFDSTYFFKSENRYKFHHKLAPDFFGFTIFGSYKEKYKIV